MLDGHRTGDVLMTVATGTLSKQECDRTGLVECHAYAVRNLGYFYISNYLEFIFIYPITWNLFLYIQLPGIYFYISNYLEFIFIYPITWNLFLYIQLPGIYFYISNYLEFIFRYLII